ncbi:MAG TPA: prephenate dehydrogenase/arogenate dehydrogenase family protein [Solirubrobacteraceae bacterium]|nr:prephenate dehydrogenase/arogenate dehydrogenase family protein [Solirubrobacteraceae bacterium]
MRIAVIGLGLIGGSIALAARERLDAEVLGWDPDPGALDAAMRRGAISARAAALGDALLGAEVVFVAAPVGALPGLVGEVLEAAAADCVVSDVGSTKRAVVAAHADQRFVGGHPLAGAETAGVEHARADLFDRATWYLTPTAITDGQLYERLHRVLSGLGAVPVALDADTHDRLLALVSHLPHVFANVLVSQAAAGSGEDGKRLPAVGPSFRDATRVAGSNSGIWTDIYMSNRDALVPAIEEAISALERVRDALQTGDAHALTGWNDAAARDHQQLMQGHLVGGDLHELRVPVPNRPGVVAQLALELGRVGVNIADLGLYPAAHMRDGVVALWISGDENADRAEQVIVELGFPVFRP